jgi:peptidyl-prolyl cis-trans isomerase C
MVNLSRLTILALGLTAASSGMADIKDTTVVARADIDGKKVEITVNELKRRQKALPAQLQGEPLEKIFEPLTQSAIDMAIITHLAKKAGLDKDEEVKARVADCQEAMLQKAYLDREIDKLQTDAALKQAYDELIKNIPDMDEISFYQAIFEDKKKAEDFIKTVKKTAAANFEEALKEAQKTDATIKGGKTPDYVKLPELPPALAAALDKVKGGVLVDKPIEEKLTPNRTIYFVVKVIDRRQSKKPEFADARADVKSITTPKYAQEVIEKARKDFKIEKFDMEGKPLTDKKAETTGETNKPVEPEKPADAKPTDTKSAEPAKPEEKKP